jgi:hypothetical protein
MAVRPIERGYARGANLTVKFEPMVQNGMRVSLPSAGLLLCAFIGCAMAATPEASNPLLHGLVPVADARVKLAYVRPGADWSKYHTIEIRPLRIPDTVRDAAPKGTRPGFGESYVLGDKEVTKLQEAYANAMQTHVATAGLPVVTAAQPDTLIVQAQITSIRLNAPIERTRRSYSSSGRVYSWGGGSMVMAAVFADGETGRVLAAAADQSYPNTYGGINNGVTNLAEAKRAFNKWAKAVRERLASLRLANSASASVGPKSN